jgi:alkanesulfonate monooxygenase SsuD/methylene tetrahydromethanopterin reductase-like flavin-dependent oxidoreductase (luciferase family)
VRAIFTSFQSGAALHYEGEHYRFDRLQPYFNPGPIDTSAPEIWTGGVGPRMCELAGETSDGFVCHPSNSHPEILRSVTLPAIEAGRQRVGRPGRGPRVIAGPQPITAATEAELETVRDERRSELAFLYSTPAYRPQLEMFGLGDLGDGLSQMAQRNDWADLGRHMTDEVIDRLVPHATFDALPDVLAEWYAGLCDGMVLAVPDDADAQTFSTLVERCKTIAPRA